MDVKGVTRASALAKNTALNLTGQLVPMVVGIITIPILIGNLGTDRFAVITISWMLIGYFGLFDMGLGRALTQLIAEKIGKNEDEDIPIVFWTSILLMLAFAVFGALIMAVLSSPLVHSVLKVPVSLQAETIFALYIMAVSIPFVVLSSAFVGMLTAYHRFDIINAIRIPMGIYSFAAPVMVLLFSSNLVLIIGVLLVGRVINCLVHLHYCLKIRPDLRTKIIVEKSIIKPLFKFGGWMTVSNIISPFMVYFDRFLIGSVVSLAAVAYYTTPYEVVRRILIIPLALMSVLFPAFASTYAENASRTAELFDRAVKFLLISVFPIVFIVVAGAHQGLTLWLGIVFADNSYRVLQWLAIGILLNSLAQVPFSFLQGIGKPDVTAKLHAVELILYIPALWLLVKSFGINGAAIAWFARSSVDMTLLFIMARRYLRPLSGLSTAAGLTIMTAVAGLILMTFLPPGNLNFTMLASVFFLIIFVGWKLLLSVSERSFLLSKLYLK